VVRPTCAGPKPSMVPRGRASKGGALALALGCALGACGGSPKPKVPIAKRVCQGDLQALEGVLGSMRMRIADSDSANIECVLIGRGRRVDVVAQATARAWTQFDTLVVHAAQAPVPGGGKGSLPQDLPGLPYNAAWIPVKRQLLATNGTQTSGGSFVTITLTGSARQGPSDLSVAQRVAAATLGVAPRGPSPGPPGS
jgi:hypothetical protein